MAGKREATRKELTQRIFEAACARVAQHGLDGANARDITRDAGCGLGTIYKCYSDLDELILHVNSASLQKLDAGLAEAVDETALPLENLLALAFAYLAFAKVNPHLWSALFKHRLSLDAEVPEWHREDHQRIFRHVVGEIERVDGRLGGVESHRRARTIFAAVHGVIALSLEGKFVGVEDEALTSEIDAVVRAMVKGFGYDQDGNGNG